MKLGTAFATAASAGLLLGSIVACGGAAPSADAPDPAAAAGAKECCKGMNACEGKGSCKTDANECAGKNACKGKGGCNAHCPK